MDAAKIAAEAKFATRLRENAHASGPPRWMSMWGGRIYRPTMKLMHRFGWCYPRPLPVEPRSVWCDWCGMRGRK